MGKKSAFAKFKDKEGRVCTVCNEESGPEKFGKMQYDRNPRPECLVCVREKKKKEGEEVTNARKENPNFIPGVKCLQCDEIFPSRNKLFRHLDASGHGAQGNEHKIPEPTSKEATAIFVDPTPASSKRGGYLATKTKHSKVRENVPDDGEEDTSFDSGLLLFIKFHRDEVPLHTLEGVAKNLGEHMEHVAYVDYKLYAEDCVLRFDSQDSLKAYTESRGGRDIATLAGDWRVLKDEEETKYWSSIPWKGKRKGRNKKNQYGRKRKFEVRKDGDNSTACDEEESQGDEQPRKEQKTKSN